MKLLKIENSCGHYLRESGEYGPMDKITKEELLFLVERTLEEDCIELEENDGDQIKNHAHQIIYKSIFQKLQSLKDRKQEFIDESARLFLEDYERYRETPDGLQNPT